MVSNPRLAGIRQDETLLPLFEEDLLEISCHDRQWHLVYDGVDVTNYIYAHYCNKVIFCVLILIFWVFLKINHFTFTSALLSQVLYFATFQVASVTE